MNRKNSEIGPNIAKNANQGTEQHVETPVSSSAGEGEIPLIPWESLDHGKGQLHIAFQGQIYHLRVTRNGKLILTK